MKLNLFLVASIIACGDGYIMNRPHHDLRSTTMTSSSSSVLEMGGFLDGKGKKNDIMEKEDAAMWVDDEDDAGGAGGWNPFAKKTVATKQPAAKKGGKAAPPAKKGKPAVVEPKKAADGGFKFPWDK